MRHLQEMTQSVRSSFIEFYNASIIPEVLTWAKTLSKLETLYIWQYLGEKKPKVIVEFGTQYGCSAAVFVEMAKSLGLKLKYHSFDIVDERKYKDFTFKQKDLTGKEEEILKLKPDLVYIDVHRYTLIENLIKLCKKNKIDFMLHDTGKLERCKQDSGGFSDKNVRTTWEAYFLNEISPIKEGITIKGNMTINTVIDYSGLSIVKFECKTECKEKKEVKKTKAKK